MVYSSFLTLAKAYFIIAEFMRLRHEIRNLILTISIPALLFIWFITALPVGWKFLQELCVIPMTNIILTVALKKLRLHLNMVKAMGEEKHGETQEPGKIH